MASRRRSLLLSAATGLADTFTGSDALSQSFFEAVEGDPENPHLWDAYGDWCVRRGDTGAAVGAHLRALAMSRSPLEEYRRLAHALERRGLDRQAARVAGEMAELFPDDPVAGYLGIAAGCATGDRLQAPDRSPDRYLRSEFDRFSEVFDDVMVRLGYRAAEALASALVDRLADRTGLDVVDVGCGTGLCGAGLRPAARLLVGVDISAGMLSRAGQRGLYDQLAESELVAYLTERPGRFDVVAASDTFIYFGPLEEPLSAAAVALRPGGLVGFTVESGSGDGHHLGFSGRYWHGEPYVRHVVRGAGFTNLEVEPLQLRTEGGRPLAGLVVTAERI